MIKKSPQQEVYSDETRCKEEILAIRERFGDKRTTKEQYEVIFRVLGLMLFYAPEKILPTVRATLSEATFREAHLHHGDNLSHALKESVKII